MKALFALFFIAFTASALATQVELEGLRQLWSLWKQNYNVEYQDNNTDEMRFNIFISNYMRIEELNNDPENTFTAGLTKFADLTPQEFKSLHVTKMSQKQEEVEVELTDGESDDESLNEEGDLPSSFTWRNKGVIDIVHDQGDCASSYVFSSVDAINSVYLIENNMTYSQFDAHFSMQQVIDCDKNNLGCNGGTSVGVFAYASKYGLELAVDYPWVGQEGKCKYNESLAFKNITTGLGIVNSIKKPNNLKSAILNQPTIVHIDAANLQFYTGGVITGNCGTILDASFLAIGYGQFEDGDAFEIKTSWGTNFGEHGYVYISTNGNANKGLGVCSVLSSPTFPKRYTQK